jgi:hypothetical protein
MERSAIRDHSNTAPDFAALLQGYDDEGVIRHHLFCSTYDSILFSKNESESRKSARGSP